MICFSNTLKFTKSRSKARSSIKLECQLFTTLRASRICHKTILEELLMTSKITVYSSMISARLKLGAIVMSLALSRPQKCFFNLHTWTLTRCKKSTKNPKILRQTFVCPVNFVAESSTQMYHWSMYRSASVITKRNMVRFAGVHLCQRTSGLHKCDTHIDTDKYTLTR